MKLKSKRILITGGAGFFGSRLVQKLSQKGCKNIFVPTEERYDLVEMSKVKKLYKDARPDIVIHLAAKVGGIGINKLMPGTFFYDNLMMGVQMMEVGRQVGIEKFVAIGTICAYPKFAPVPFREKDLWNGYPEETNAAYGLAKKMLLVQSQAYRQQYEFNSIYLLPVNMYGPGDNFDPKTSHVIPALIRKCVEAIEAGKRNPAGKQPPITIWGTGKATREFIYVDDAAEAVILAAERYDKGDPVNIGSGNEISIRELVDLIVRLTGFKGKIIWDASKPDGQPKRRLDVSRARKEFGFKARVRLIDGLRETIEWYRINRTIKR